MSDIFFFFLKLIQPSFNVVKPLMNCRNAVKLQFDFIQMYCLSVISHQIVAESWLNTWQLTKPFFPSEQKKKLNK